MKKALIFISTIALLGAFGCGHEEHHEKEEKTKFIATTPMIADTAIVKDYVCQIKSIRHIELRTQEKGYLQNIYVDEGQFVKKGQLLFRIMPKMYQAEVNIAKAEVDLAEIEYKNTKGLADQNVVSANELAMAKAKLDKAKAQFKLAKVHLDFTEIRAPFDGLIDRFHVRLGSLLDEGELLTELSDNSKMWVYFNVSEAEYLDYKSEMKEEDPLVVNLMMANNKPFKYSGVVETIEADFNNETGNIPFRATFPNPEGLLRHGETGNVQVNVPWNNAMLIPQKSTFEILDKHYVFLIDKNSRIRTREISIGAELPHVFVVTQGLKSTDKILLEGLRKVKEKDKVEFEMVSAEVALGQLGLYAE